MKKLFVILAVVCFLGIGCVQTSGPVGTDKILKTTNSIYLDIRTIVTDPEVLPMFSQKELERLEYLEKRYLQVADTLRTFPNDSEAIEQISWIATEILMILNEVAFVDNARPYIAAIRISIQILRNHL